MSSAFDIDEQAERSGTGTQNFTASIGSVNGEAGIFLASRATVLGTITSDAELTFGFVSGASSEANFQSNANDAGAPSFKTTPHSSQVGRHTLIGSTTVEDRAAANGQLTDGLQLTWAVKTTQYRMIAGLLGGAEIDAAVVTVDEVTTAVDGTFVISGLSFQPQAIIIFYNGESGSADKFEIGAGIAVDNGAGTDQFTACINVQEGGGTSIADGGFLTNRVFARIGTTSITNSWEVTGWETDGVTFTNRIAAGANRTAAVLCLASSDWDFVAGQYDIPTSGNIVVSGLGIDPDFLFEVLTQIQNEDIHINGNAQAGAIGLALNSFAFEHGVSGSVEHNSSTPAAKSLTKATTVCLDDSGALSFEATTAFDPGGFTKTPTSHPSSVTKGFYLAAGLKSGNQVVLRRRRM